MKRRKFPVERKGTDRCSSRSASKSPILAANRCNSARIDRKVRRISCSVFGSFRGAVPLLEAVLVVMAFFGGGGGRGERWMESQKRFSIFLGNFIFSCLKSQNLLKFHLNLSACIYSNSSILLC